MGVLDGKKGLVVGVANDRSYAWHIADSLRKQGAELLFTHLPGDKMARRARLAIDSLYGENEEKPWATGLDATDEDSLAECFAAAAKQAGGKLEFLVYSIEFADRTYLEIGTF